MDYAIGSPEWTPYILSQLREDEKSNGYPRREGLRRLTKEYVGDFEEPRIQIMEYPSLLPNGIKTKIGDKYIFVYNPAIVQCVISINIKNGPATVPRAYSHIGEANIDNTGAFAMWPLSVATARAEAGCLRKILQLANVYSIEEMGEPNPNISDAQINVMQFMCQKNEIDLNKFLIKNTDKAYDLAKIRDIPALLANDLIQQLTKSKRKDA